MNSENCLCKFLALFDNVLIVAHLFCKTGKLQNVIRHIVASFLCLITHSAKKAYRALEVQRHTFLNSH